MKKILNKSGKLFCLAVFALLCAFTVAACDGCGSPGLVYIPINGGTAYEVLFAEHTPDFVGKVVIPSKYKGLPVTEIASRAFEGCSGLTSIIIPNSIVRIGYDAFYNCSGLTSIAIPDGVTEIESGTFAGCNSLKNIKIPSSVKSIEEWAFSGCNSLKSITIPLGVTSIGLGTFSDCDALTTIYYTGTEQQWENIDKRFPDIPPSAEIIFNYTGE